MRRMFALIMCGFLLLTLFGCEGEEISADCAPEYYSGEEAVRNLETALEKDGESAYCLPVSLPYDAAFSGIQRQAGVYVEALYQLTTENEAEGANIAYSLNPGYVDTRMESIVYNNMEMYEELEWQGKTVYYTYDDLIKEISPRHCFVYAEEEGVVTVAIPEKILADGESVTISREEALDYIGVEIVKAE